jgi:hypothetical protein
MTRTSFSVATGTVKRPPIETVSQGEKANCRNAPTNEVSLLPTLSYSERQSAIVRCQALITKYSLQWEEYGCFAAKGNLDRVSGILAQLEGQE